MNRKWRSAASRDKPEAVFPEPNTATGSSGYATEVAVIVKQFVACLSLNQMGMQLYTSYKLASMWKTSPISQELFETHEAYFSALHGHIAQAARCSLAAARHEWSQLFTKIHVLSGTHKRHWR